MAKPLGVLSRSAINRSVKRQHIDSLRLPQLLKDECFENVGRDRTEESIPARKSLEPCDCCYFRAEDYEVRVPEWGEFFVPRYALFVTYKSTIWGLATDADWLKLPDRESLLEEYESDDHRKEDLEACLNTLRFDPSTGLGEAHEWIRRYIYYGKRHGWYHVTVCVNDMVRFVEAMKEIDLVVLPYGCVSDGGFGFEGNELIRWRKHNRQMIVAVKDEHRDSFREAIDEIWAEKEARAWYPKSTRGCIEIECVVTLVRKIALVGQPYEDDSELHYVIFQPVIRHAVWWMLLLVPREMLERFARITMRENGIDETTVDDGKRVYASTELGIENCVVRLHPPHQCIGDPIDDLKLYISKKRPHVYWFGGKVLSVTEMKDVPSRVMSSERQFVLWCNSREMNTLLNLNSDGWVDFSCKRLKLYDNELEWAFRKELYYAIKCGNCAGFDED